MTMSPIERVQSKKVKESPNINDSPVANQHSGNSSDGSERSKVLHVTSTPVKFNLDEDFPPVSSQNISARWVKLFPLLLFTHRGEGCGSILRLFL